MTPACAAKLEAWRAAQADALRVDDLHAAERATIAVAVREAYAAVCTPKQHDRLAPAPPAPCSFSDLSCAYMQDEGVNPSTLWSCVPYRLVQAAGADIASSSSPPAPLAWETLESDAPLPDVE